MSDVKYCCAKCGSLRILHNSWEPYNPEAMPWAWQVGLTTKDWCDDCGGFCEIAETPTSNPPEGGIGGTVSSASEPINQP
jgi:hypothetical protein